MRQLPELNQLCGVAYRTVRITYQNLAAAAVGALDGFRQSFADGDQEPDALRSAVQRPNLIAGLHCDADIEDIAVRAQRARDRYLFHNSRGKHQEAVICSSAAAGLELTRGRSAGHAAGFHKFIHPADMMRNLRSVPAPTARAQFKEHRTVIGITEFNVSHTLRQSQREYCTITHIGHGCFLHRRQLGRVLDADIHTIGKSRLDLLSDAKNGSLALPDEHFGTVFAALDALLDNDLGMRQPAGLSRVESVGNLLEPLDASDA